MDIALGLLLAGKSKKKKSKSVTKIPQRKTHKTNTPAPDVRFDGYYHWPEHINEKKKMQVLYSIIF